MYFPKLLVLSCCAPCSCAAIKKLADDGIDATVLFYNPNIYPSAEYEKRRDEQKRACEHFKIPFIELPYEPEATDTDNWALTHGYVAITPTRIDVTDYETLKSFEF